MLSFTVFDDEEPTHDPQTLEEVFAVVDEASGLVEEVVPQTLHDEAGLVELSVVF